MATVKSITFNNKDPEQALKISTMYLKQKGIDASFERATSKFKKRLVAFRANLGNVIYEFTPEYAVASAMVNGSTKEIASVNAGKFFPMESKNILTIAANYELYLSGQMTSLEFKQNLMRECTYEENDYKILAKTLKMDYSNRYYGYSQNDIDDEEKHEHQNLEIPTFNETDYSQKPQRVVAQPTAPTTTPNDYPSSNDVSQELQEAKNMRDSLQDRIMDLEMSGNPDQAKLSKLKQQFNFYCNKVKQLKGQSVSSNVSPNSPNNFFTPQNKENENSSFDNNNPAQIKIEPADDFDINSLTRTTGFNINDIMSDDDDENNKFVFEDDVK